MDLSYTAEQDAFRREVRAWLAGNVSRGLPSAGTEDGFQAHRAWERKLFDAGFGALAWPVEYGGRGADVVMRAIFEEEYVLADGPERITVIGHNLMGPTLMTFGTDDQKRQWLPGILSTEAIWSQGFSEPNAGSDLAAIATRAVRDGDDLVVNGQKIWTSYGAHADWIFALVRTDPDAQRHRGITFLAIDMRAPGVEARPIVQLDGFAGFAEVFFTDVRVPVANVIGAVDDGWSVAMATLGFERDAPAATAARYLREVAELADGAPDWARDRIGSLYARALAYRAWTLRTLARLSRGESIGHEASMTKVAWSELERDIYTLAREIGPVDPSKYWFARAATIYAGTSEIQRNIISERLLGLPR